MSEIVKMPGLLNCPFCHCDDIELEEAHHEYFWVCQNVDCNATGPWDLGESGATEKWNTRPIEDALRAEIERLTAEIESLRLQLEIKKDYE